jgi:hypothetical protein
MSNQLIHETTHNQMKHINWLIIINMHFTFILLYNFNFQKILCPDFFYVIKWNEVEWDMLIYCLSIMIKCHPNSFHNHLGDYCKLLFKRWDLNKGNNSTWKFSCLFRILDNLFSKNVIMVRLCYSWITFFFRYMFFFSHFSFT